MVYPTFTFLALFVGVPIAYIYRLDRTFLNITESISAFNNGI